MAQATLNVGKSAYVSQYYVNDNFNNPKNLFLGLFNQPNSIYESFLQFDLTPIKAGSTVTKATLKLYINKLSNEDLANQFIEVQQNSSDFDATTITWSNQPTTVNSAISKTITKADVAKYADIDITTIVQAWMSKPQENYGITLAGQIDKEGVIYITNSDEPSKAPQLVIDYTEPSKVTLGTKETLTFTAASTLQSASVNSNNVPVSFYVKGTESAGTAVTVTCGIEISDDGTNWYYDKEKEFTISLNSSSESVTISTVALGSKYRFKGVSTGAVSVDVTPVTLS